MRVRKAELADVLPIIRLIKPYYEESMFAGWRKINEERLFARIYSCVMDEGLYTLVAETEGGGIAGILIAYQNWSFFDDDEMDIDFFYIHPDYTGTQAARSLVSEIIKIARGNNIAVLYCGCHSAMDDGGLNDKLFTNLFKKFGFAPTGTNLHLVLKEQ